jgi:hypothetical protein
MGEGNDEFGLVKYFVHTCSDFLHAIKSYNMGSPTLLPLQRKMCCGFLSPLESIAFDIEPANRGSNGKDANHYTTEATSFMFSSKN